MATSSSARTLLLALVPLLAGGTVRAQGLTQDEALRVAFPAPAAIERRTVFLSPAQLDSVRALAGPGVEVRQGIVTLYVGRDGAGRPLGAAYFDAHRVRTLNEVVMVVVRPDATVGLVEVLRFAEPPDYAASAGWISQLAGQSLGPQLALKGAIANQTGATLTANALVRATRRVLAYHALARPFGAAP